MQYSTKNYTIKYVWNVVWQKKEQSIILEVKRVEISGLNGISILILFETSKGSPKLYNNLHSYQQCVKGSF